MEDQLIIALYRNRDERAIACTQAKYGDYCFSVADRILGDRLDSEEAVSDTWLRAWNSIPPEEPKFLKLYLAKIARNLALSTYRRRNARKRGSGVVDAALCELSEVVGERDSVDDGLNVRALGRDIQRFLNTVSARDKDFFIRRYFYLDEVAEIAQDSGTRESTVLVSLSRTRKKLRTYLIREGYDL